LSDYKKRGIVWKDYSEKGKEIQRELFFKQKVASCLKAMGETRRTVSPLLWVSSKCGRIFGCASRELLKRSCL